MRNISKPVLIGGGLVLTAIVAFVAFGIFGIQTLFIDNEVSEANPFEVNAAAAPVTEGDETDASDSDAEDDSSTEADPADEPEAPAEQPASEPEILTLTTGSFVGTSRYTTIGTGLTITDGTQTFLRFEGFETTNGPDLNVYLRNSEDPDDYLDLGDLSGNIGDQNYELPEGIDLDRYDFVDIWCVRFGVSFGNAQLNAA